LFLAVKSALHASNYSLNVYFFLIINMNGLVSDNSTLQEDSHDGEIMFAIRSYIAENEDALDLVEGEKVYVIGKLIFLFTNLPKIFVIFFFLF